jgi:hypothetical protein
MRPANQPISDVPSSEFLGGKSVWRLPSGRTLLDYIIGSRMAAPALALAVLHISPAEAPQKSERKG